MLAFAATGLTCALLTISLPITGWIVERAEARQDREHPVVVINKDGTLLRKGNGFAYPPRYEAALNRGVEARLILAKEDWIQIELSDGEVGWVPRGQVLLCTSD